MSNAESINNGSRVDVDFGFYKGRAGLIVGSDGGLRVSMIAALPRGNKEPTEGVVDGERVEVLAIEKGTLDKRFTVLLIRKVPEAEAPADDGGNEAG